MKRGVFAGVCSAVLVSGILVFSSWAQEAPLNGASATFPEPVYTFDAVYEGVSVPHEFVIQNKGSADLEVKRVDGG